MSSIPSKEEMMDFNYQRPRKLEVEELTDNYGRFTAEPFERGYGSTIGISMRRVLLSLIPGTAITSVRIEGALHEFSVIPGIYEDVLNVILNLKNIPLKMNINEQKILTIDKKGPGEVLSSDINTDSDVEILDKNVHIAYLEENAHFKAELVVNKGVGFVVAEQNYDPELPVDFIPIDSNFSPIEKVRYSISPARVGKRTDYEKLVIEVWTNGSISPRETASIAGNILREHLSIFLNIKDEFVIKPEVVEETSSIEDKIQYLEKNVESMGLSQRAYNCMKRLDIDYVYQLVIRTPEELLKSKNFGQKSLNEIKNKLNEFGLDLGLELSEDFVKRLDNKVGVKEKEIEKKEENTDKEEEKE